MEWLIIEIFSLFWQLLGFFSLLLAHRVLKYRKTPPILLQLKGLNVIRFLRSSGNNFDISIVIPAYNEANRIEHTLLSLFRFLKKSTLSAEIVLVDDGSLDGTFQRCYALVSILLVKNDCPMVSIILATYHRNSGKGKAVIVGMYLSTAPKILIMDADGATNYTEIARFNKLVRNNELLCGARRSSQERRSLVRHWCSDIFRYIKAVLLGLNSIDDTQCGFKILDRAMAVSLLPFAKVEGWTFDIELILLGISKGFNVRSLTVDWQDKKGSKLRLLEDVPSMFTELCLLVVIRQFK